MKTALTELIEKWENQKSFSNEHRLIFESFINDLKQQLTTEKEQIIQAYWGGLNGYINDYSEPQVKEGGGAEQYFNQTFLSNENTK